MAVNFLFVVFFALKLAAGSPATIINRNPYAPLQPSNSGKHSVKTVKLYPHESFPTCETNIVTAVSRDNRKWGWEKRRSCIMPEDLDKYEYKLNEEQSPEKLRDAKSRSVKLYPGENFPVCSTNVVTAISSDNRKWGWENSKSCIMPDGLPNYEYKVNNDQQGIKPVGYENCKNQDKAKVTVYGADGKLWGYENGKSCRIVNAGGTDNEKNHHNPSNRTLGDTAKGNTTGGFIPGRGEYRI
ncbi:hypothetical protein BKA69DRAFT_152019 [Paraphysoderma sedebokerense]|nr:hypothetical protein BKA69DRAFT_152019 [Paraphysoderma sedebokerense]